MSIFIKKSVIYKHSHYAILGSVKGKFEIISRGFWGDFSDNTDIHPDQYSLAKYIVENQVTLPNYASHRSSIQELYADTNEDTLDFILKSYQYIGLEKRVGSTHTKARKKLAMDLIKEGDIFDGVVRNVVAFGAFIDIGLKSDGLVHVSQLANKFVTNPSDIVSVGDRVKVRITSIDTATGKIQLSMRDI